MSPQRQRSLASSLLIASLLVTLMSFGGGWGAAYGQSAGLAPTPIPGGGLPPGNGAEGVPPRQEAIAGEAGEVAEGSVRETVPGGAPVNVPVGVPANVPPAVGVPTRLDATGADSNPLWPLFIAGVVLFAVGGTLFIRSRRTR